MALVSLFAAVVVVVVVVVVAAAVYLLSFLNCLLISISSFVSLLLQENKKEAIKQLTNLFT